MKKYESEILYLWKLHDDDAFLLLRSFDEIDKFLPVHFKPLMPGGNKKVTHT